MFLMGVCRLPWEVDSGACPMVSPHSILFDSVILYPVMHLFYYVPFFSPHFLNVRVLSCPSYSILLYSSLLYSILFWDNEATSSGKDASLVFGDLVFNTQAFGMRCSRSYYTCVWLLLRRRMRRRLGMDGQERHHPLVEGMLV